MAGAGFETGATERGPNLVDPATFRSNVHVSTSEQLKTTLRQLLSFQPSPSADASAINDLNHRDPDYYRASLVILCKNENSENSGNSQPQLVILVSLVIVSHDTITPLYF